MVAYDRVDERQIGGQSDAGYVRILHRIDRDAASVVAIAAAEEGGVDKRRAVGAHLGDESIFGAVQRLQRIVSWEVRTSR